MATGAGSLAKQTLQKMRRQKSKHGPAHCGSFSVHDRGNSFMNTVPQEAQFLFDLDAESSVFIEFVEEETEMLVKPQHLHPYLADEDDVLGPYTLHKNTNSLMNVIPATVQSIFQVTGEDSVETYVDREEECYAVKPTWVVDDHE